MTGSRPFELERWFEFSYAPDTRPHHLAVDEDSPYALLEMRLYNAILTALNDIQDRLSKG